MEIKPRYNELRVGAMFIEPVKATANDLDDYVMATRIGSMSSRIWQFGRIDCRALAGKLFNDERIEDLIMRTENDFLLVVNVDHPKIQDKLLIGGNETKTIVVYRNRKIEKHFKKIEAWLQKYLSGIPPVAHLLKYGRRNKFGLKERDGVLCYVMVNVGSSITEMDVFGQPYTEASWGYVD